MRRVLAFLAPLAVVAALSGCGPSRAAALHSEVEAALAAARDAGAPDRAPYEWTAAETYYNASKADAGRSDYEGAGELAEKALEYAERARQKALSDPAPAPAPEPVPPAGPEGGNP